MNDMNNATTKSVCNMNLDELRGYACCLVDTKVDTLDTHMLKDAENIIEFGSAADLREFIYNLNDPS